MISLEGAKDEVGAQDEVGDKDGTREGESDGMLLVGAGTAGTVGAAVRLAVGSGVATDGAALVSSVVAPETSAEGLLVETVVGVPVEGAKEGAMEGAGVCAPTSPTRSRTANTIAESTAFMMLRCSLMNL
jgi:hypothetical protein